MPRASSSTWACRFRSTYIGCCGAICSSFATTRWSSSSWPPSSAHGRAGPALLAVPGLALLLLNGIWAALLLGVISARFRDVPPIVASIVRILFFVTPIIWMPGLMPERALVLDFNPFFHMVEVVRAPLLGTLPGLVSWLAVLGITLGGWIVAFEFFRRYRWRIAYWV